MLTIETLATSSLVPYAGNAKEHPAAQVAQIVASIKEFGFNDPIAVDENNVIIEGHGRLLAAKKLKLKEVPIIRLIHLSDAQKSAYIIAHNKLTMNTGFDADILKTELASLQGFDFDLALTGFDLTEVGEYLKGLEPITDPAGDVDDVPEPPTEPITALGDIYEIGAHRLVCGDSCKIEDVEKLLNGTLVDLVLSDPPYGVSVVKAQMVGADFGVAPKGKYEPVIGDETTDIARAFYEVCGKLNLTQFIIWGGNYFTDFLPPSNSWVVWNKRGDSGIRNTFADAELAWSNIGFPVRIHNQLWNGMIREGEHGKRVHPTQKPVALFAFCLDLAPKAKTVFDGFCGSGSSLIAAHESQRQAFMMEQGPHYCDVIVTRMRTLFPDLPITRNGEPFQ